MSNGKIDDTKVELLVHGPREELDRFLVTSVTEIRHTLDEVCAQQKTWTGLVSRFVVPVVVSVTSAVLVLLATGAL